ncbi:MAG: hypothetical protein OXN25_15065 [Candidatus Poribacteria bacterium]|nr:hypothetical protein [Candidatus Poribacteria bacterium]
MTVKTLAHIGIVHIEEAIATILFGSYPEWTRAVDLNRMLGYKDWDTADWIVGVILPKMESAGRLMHRREGGRATGWKLTETEYNRLNGDNNE